MDSERPLSIGALAAAAGVGVETVRFYERRGILPEPPRTRAGYRQYTPDTVSRLRFIRRAQGLGFTLGEIQDLLDLRVDEVGSCGAVEARARAKLADVDSKLAELHAIRRALGRLVDACRAREATVECPVLEALEDGEED